MGQMRGCSGGARRGEVDEEVGAEQGGVSQRGWDG